MQAGAELRLQSRRQASRSAGKVWAATLPPDQESYLDENAPSSFVYLNLPVAPIGQLGDKTS